KSSLVTLVPPKQLDGDLFPLPVMDQHAVIAFSPDCKMLASSGSKNTIRLWQVETGKLITTLTGHSDDVSSLSFSADGRTLASGSADRTIKLWEVATGTARLTFKNAVSDKMLWYSISSDNGKEVDTNYTGFVDAVAFSSDGRPVAAAAED